MVSAEDSGPDFDLAAAGLRADGADLRISLEALAKKLELSLPGRARVERSGGGLLRRGERQVRELSVDMSGTTYQLIAGEPVECFRERRVGGISIKREPLDPEAWLAALTAELRSEAERSSEARASLERLLG